MTAIYSYYNLYKICKLCKKAKGYHDYKYDISILRTSRINVTRPNSNGKLMRYKMTYDKATAYIEGGVAGITSESSIRKFYPQNRFKKMVLKRDSHRCAYCGEKGTTVDHLVAKSAGGLSTFTNCVCACKKCNVAKGCLSIRSHLKKMGLICDQELTSAEQKIISKAFIPFLPINTCPSAAIRLLDGFFF